MLSVELVVDGSPKGRNVSDIAWADWYEKFDSHGFTNVRIVSTSVSMNMLAVDEDDSNEAFRRTDEPEVMKDAEVAGATDEA
jgi:hypothetical protein